MFSNRDSKFCNARRRRTSLAKATVSNKASTVLATRTQTVMAPSSVSREMGEWPMVAKEEKPMTGV